MAQSGRVTDRCAAMTKPWSVPVQQKHPSEKGALGVTLKACCLAFDRGEYSVFFTW